MAISRHRANHCALEVGMYPHIQSRTNLPDGCGLLAAFDGKSEFKRMDQVLSAVHLHHAIVSVGGDAGTECSEVRFNALFLLDGVIPCYINKCYIDAIRYGILQDITGYVIFLLL